MKAAWKPYIRAAVCAFVLFLAITYWGQAAQAFSLFFQALSPLLMGGAMAYIINILMTFYEKRLPIHGVKWEKAKRPVCLLLAVITVILTLFMLFQLIIPQLISCFQILIKALPKTLRAFYAWLEQTFNISAWLSEQSLKIPETAQDWEELARKYASVLFTGVGGVMNVAVSAVSTVIGSLVAFFLSLIFAIYLLTGKEKLASQVCRLSRKVFGCERTDKALSVLRVVNSSFHNYIVGQCLEALILGTLCAVGMLILQLPYAIMIGALVGVTALIPVAGAYIGAGIGAIMIFSVDPVKALIFLIFLVILQQIEGNVIYPHTVGTSLGLPGIWVLSAVTIGGGVMGIMGMMLFVPLTAAAYQLTRSYLNKPCAAKQKSG